MGGYFYNVFASQMNKFKREEMLDQKNQRNVRVWRCLVGLITGSR